MIRPCPPWCDLVGDEHMPHLTYREHIGSTEVGYLPSGEFVDVAATWRQPLDDQAPEDPHIQVWLCGDAGDTVIRLTPAEALLIGRAHELLKAIGDRGAQALREVAGKLGHRSETTGLQAVLYGPRQVIAKARRGEPMNPATDKERRRRQRRAIRLLVDVDKRHPDLPVITWSVSEWALVAQCHGLDRREQRWQFDAWVDALGLTRWQERSTSSGSTRLHATSKDFEGRGVDVAVTAHVFDDLEEDEI